MPSTLRFTLNGAPVEVAGLEVHTTLLHFLRSRGLTGTKEGCAEGECGACAVVMVDGGAEGEARYEAVNACLVLMPMVDGRTVWTVEGVARDGTLHPVQAALVDAAGSQCGYCTPGFVMSMFAHYYRCPRDSAESALGGNLCRCTGYRPIRDAVRALPQVSPDDPFLRALAPAHTADPRPIYQARDATFLRPRSLAQALEARAERPDALLLGGGTDLVVDVNQRRARQPGFIALEGVSELRTVSVTENALVLGAGLTWNELEARLGERVPLLSQLLPLFASRLVRARATLGGNLATASPVGDAAPVLLALDAELELASVRGRRRLPIAEFFTGTRQTALAADELIAFVRIPEPVSSSARFYKVSKRPLDDISCVSAGLSMRFDGDRIGSARIAFGGVADRPVRALAAEAACVGRPLDRQTLQDAQAALRGHFAPWSDVRGSSAYRVALLESLLEKFWLEATP